MTTQEEDLKRLWRRAARAPKTAGEVAATVRRLQKVDEWERQEESARADDELKREFEREWFRATREPETEAEAAETAERRKRWQEMQDQEDEWERQDQEAAEEAAREAALEAAKATEERLAAIERLLVSQKETERAGEKYERKSMTTWKKLLRDLFFMLVLGIGVVYAYSAPDLDVKSILLYFIAYNLFKSWTSEAIQM